MHTHNPLVTGEQLAQYPVFPVPIIFANPTREFYDTNRYGNKNLFTDSEQQKYANLLTNSQLFLQDTAPLILADQRLADDTETQSPHTVTVRVRERSEQINDTYGLPSGRVTLVEYAMHSQQLGTDTLYSFEYDGQDAHGTSFLLAYSAEEGVLEHQVSGLVPAGSVENPFDRVTDHLSQAHGRPAIVDHSYSHN